MALDLGGTVAVVTGGANGIGRAAAAAYAAAGATPVIGDVDGDAAAAAADALGGTGMACDVRSSDAIAALAEQAAAAGPVSVVMANAGVAVGGRWEVVPIDEWQRLFDINVHGVVRTVQAFLPGLIERGAGHIVITGSSAGLFNADDGFDGPYRTSKHALLGMARSLARYCEPHGVQVHLLAPRLTDTAFPRSSVAWGRKGPRVTSDRPVPASADTAEEVADALVAGMAAGDFLVSLTPDTGERLARFAASLDPFSDSAE